MFRKVVEVSGIDTLHLVAFQYAPHTLSHDVNQNVVHSRNECYVSLCCLYTAVVIFYILRISAIACIDFTFWKYRVGIGAN